MPPVSLVHLFCVFLCAKYCYNPQQIFSNLITASFVPRSPNLTWKQKPRLWHPRAGGLHNKWSSVFYSSRTYTTFQNIYSTFCRNLPMSNIHRVLSLARTKEYCIYTDSFYLPHTIDQHTSRKWIQVVVWLWILFSWITVERMLQQQV